MTDGVWSRRHVDLCRTSASQCPR
ncbi:putative leader peptide [Rhodococcus daqingensis]|uniref:Leader peptide n=1 Tax=Rhodococcus daqingensis TaxID=2479363 RepID=A0ABW2S5B3_9NOCA